MNDRAEPTRILSVCLGNICRSPTAEVLLRTHVAGARVDSAGTAGWHTGKPPYGPMQQAALRRGHDLSGLRARQVTPEDFRRFDLVLAMDRENLSDLRRLQPSDGIARLALFLDPLDGGDVPDPYYTRDFDGALDLIDRGARAWAERLAKGGST